MPQIGPFFKSQEHNIKLNKNRTTLFRGIFHACCEQIRDVLLSQNLVPNL